MSVASSINTGHASFHRAAGTPPLVDAGDVTRGVRQTAWPALRAEGFAAFTGRIAWQYVGEAVDVVNFQSRSRGSSRSPRHPALAAFAAAAQAWSAEGDLFGSARPAGHVVRKAGRLEPGGVPRRRAARASRGGSAVVRGDTREAFRGGDVKLLSRAAEALRAEVRFWNDVRESRERWRRRYGDAEWSPVPADEVYALLEEIAQPARLGLEPIRRGLFGRQVDADIVQLLELRP
jgi:hypothetical protein